MRPEWSEFLDEAVQSVHGDSEGNLAFRFRLRLQELLLRFFPEENRYAILCFLSAKELLPAWESLDLERYYREMPRGFLELGRTVILDPSRRYEVKRVAAALPHPCSASHASGELLGHYLLAKLATEAAASALDAVLDQHPLEIFHEDDTEFTIEPDLWDTHAFIAADCAGCIGAENSKPDARRGYWLRFLSDDVPRMFTSSREDLIRQVTL
jgi:hypothetical protein